MKIALSGKGGVGKSTIAASLAYVLTSQGKKVLAVDADPDANLASALGIAANEQKKIITISKHKSLIEERTGAKLKEYGQIFKLNPEVSDIADNFAYNHRGISLLVLGAIKGGGAGCACPENTLLKSLVNDLVLRRNETLILDMEAGIEHLGRSTAMGINAMLIVVEPGQRSIDSAKRIIQLSKEIGIQRLAIIINKSYSEDDREMIAREITDAPVIGRIPFSKEILAGDRENTAVIDTMNEDIKDILKAIVEHINGLEALANTSFFNNNTN